MPTVKKLVCACEIYVSLKACFRLCTKMSLPKKEACKVCSRQVFDNFNKAFLHLTHHLSNGDIRGNQCLFCDRKITCKNGGLRVCFQRHLQKDHQLQPIQSVRKHVCKICFQTLVLFDENSKLEQNHGLIKDHYLKTHFPLHSTEAQPPTPCIFEQLSLIHI